MIWREDPEAVAALLSLPFLKKRIEHT